jgi:phosphoribosyl-ATP pyrophosphohydrolase
MGEFKERGLFKSLGFTAIANMECKLSLIAKPEENLEQPLRVATSFPALSKKLLKDKGFEIDYIQDFGGKVEGKVKYGNYNCIVDIVETGETIKGNGLEVRLDLIDPLQTGLVYRIEEDINVAENIFPLVGISSAIKTIGERKKQLDEGADFDPNKKSTLLLLSDQNKLFKALGEEMMEFGRALMLGEGEVEEAADIFFTVFTALTANNQSPLEVFNELTRRNK